MCNVLEAAEEALLEREAMLIFLVEPAFSMVPGRLLIQHHLTRGDVKHY